VRCPTAELRPEGRKIRAFYLEQGTGAGRTLARTNEDGDATTARVGMETCRGLICQMRASCLENGVAIRQGAGVFKLDLARVVTEEKNDMTPTMRRLLSALFNGSKSSSLASKPSRGDRGFGR
jgi:hypothetical protein